MILKKVVVFLLIASFSLELHGQANESTDKGNTDTFSRGFGLGFGVGLKGFTAQLSYAFHPNLYLRAEVHGLKIEDLTVDLTFSGQTLRTIGNVDLLNTGLILDYFPAPATSSFHFFLGLSYASNQRMQGRGLYPEPVEYGELTFEGEEIGYVDGQLITNSLMPQFGIAFGRSRPKRAAGLRLEIGTYYWGAPTVQLEATGMLANTVREEEKINNNLNAYRWWPFVNLALNFRL